jgi:hypothetical protein
MYRNQCKYFLFKLYMYVKMSKMKVACNFEPQANVDQSLIFLVLVSEVQDTHGLPMYVIIF